MAEQHFVIAAEEGLHARPAAALVGEANRFASEMTLVFKDKTVNLKSILGVMSLGIPVNSAITIKAQGPDEKEAIDSVRQLLKRQNLLE